MGVDGLQRIVFKYLEVGWTSRFWDTLKCKREIGTVAILGSLQRSERASLFYNWYPMSLSPTPPSSRDWYLSSPAMSWVLQASPTHTSSCCYSHVVWAKPKLVFHIVGGMTLLFHTLYVGTWLPCLLVLTLALHKVHVLACNAQHLLVELGAI